MFQSLQLQQIIGVSKKNPYLTVCASSENPNEFLVFYGATLFEKMKKDKQSPTYKMCIARLYNGGVKLCTLTKVFGVSEATVKRWGKAIKCGNTEELLHLFSGPGRPKKVTDEINAFVKLRFQTLYRQSRTGYSSQMRHEIKEVFGIELCGETLRPIFKKLKENFSKDDHDDQISCGSTQTTNGEAADEPDLIEQRQLPGNLSSDHSVAHCPPNERHVTSSELELIGDSQNYSSDNNRQNRTSTCDYDIQGSSDSAWYEGRQPAPDANPGDMQANKTLLPLRNNRKKSFGFYFNEHQPVLSNHAGVLLMSSLLNDFRAKVDNAFPFLQQLLVAILLGAKNIEQTKLLDYDSLQALLGITIGSIFRQRLLLTDHATDNIIEQCLAFNAQLVGSSSCRDFYYDPHTKHYTGHFHILKGWCSAANAARKVLHMDFVHAASGEPLWINYADNFHDLRERFEEVPEKIRTLLGLDKTVPLTFVVDRGIYKISLFEHICSSPNHIITWEKGYQKGQWDENEVNGQFVMQRCRNYAEDLLLYHFHYIDQCWSKSDHMRQIIVQATNPKQKKAEVSILTDDTNRSAQEIIGLMFSRWIQENDFKYLIQHFGINEITSYGVIPYQKFEKKIKDRDIKSGEYKALEITRKELKQLLSKLLLTQHRSNTNSGERKKEITLLSRQLQSENLDKLTTKDLSRHLKRLTRREEKEKTKRVEWKEQITLLTQKLEEVEKIMTITKKDVSRLQTVISKGYVRLDVQSKTLMDTLKILARNMFYHIFQPFRKLYNNYRDDHVIWRHLTRAQGSVLFGKQVVLVTLYPTMRYQPKLHQKVENYLKMLNDANPTMPDGSHRRLQFALGKRKRKLFILENEDNL